MQPPAVDPALPDDSAPAIRRGFVVGKTEKTARKGDECDDTAGSASTRRNDPRARHATASVPSFGTVASPGVTSSSRPSDQ